MILAAIRRSRPVREIARLFRDRRGATAIEYALIVSLIVVAMIGALGGVANKTISMWNNVSTQVLRYS